MSNRLETAENPEQLKRVVIEPLTRVEGHGNIVIDVKNGELVKCEWQIVEAPRFFEAFLRQTRALRVKPADLGGEFLGTNCVLGDICICHRGPLLFARQCDLSCCSAAFLPTWSQLWKLRSVKIASDLPRHTPSQDPPGCSDA